MSRKTALALIALAALLALALWIGPVSLRDDPPDRIRITIPAPGADPVTLDEQVSTPLTTALIGVPELRSLDVVARDGVVVALATGEGDLRASVLSALERIDTPDIAETPFIEDARPASRIRWALHGPGARERNEQLAHRVTSTPGVQGVARCAASDELSVEVDEARLRAYDLTAFDVAAALAGADRDEPLGVVRAQGDEILVRGAPESAVARVGEIAVAVSHGAPVTVADVATIERRRGVEGCACVASEGDCATGTAALADEAARPSVVALVEDTGGVILGPRWTLSMPEGSSRDASIRLASDLARAAPAGAAVEIDPPIDSDEPDAELALSLPADLPADEIERAWQAVGAHPGTAIARGRGVPAVLRLTGADRASIARAVAEIARRLVRLPGVRVVGALENDRRELRVQVDRERAAAVGVTPRDAARALRMATGGEVVATWMEGRDTLDVRVRTASRRPDEVRVPTAGGGGVPLGEVARPEQAAVPRELWRCDGSPCARITIEGGDADALGSAREAVEHVELPAGLTAAWVDAS